jgi:hypothetical protein
MVPLGLVWEGLNFRQPLLATVAANVSFCCRLKTFLSDYGAPHFTNFFEADRLLPHLLTHFSFFSHIFWPAHLAFVM